MRTYVSGKMSVKRNGVFEDVSIDCIVEYSSTISPDKAVLVVDKIEEVGAYDLADDNVDLSPSELIEATAILTNNFYVEEMS